MSDNIDDIKTEQEAMRQAEFDSVLATKRAQQTADKVAEVQAVRNQSRADRIEALRKSSLFPSELNYLPSNNYTNYATRVGRPHINPLTESEEQLARLYRGPEKPAPVASPYLVKSRKPTVRMSIADRYKQKEKERQDMRQRFVNAYPEQNATVIDALITQAKAANARAERIANMNDPNRKPKKEKKKLTSEEILLQKWHNTKPNVMTNPAYTAALQRYRGDHYYPANDQWIGLTPQTMKSDDYNSMVKNFSEMVGVLNMRPDFDQRLLTEASARELLGDVGYLYETLDMDSDPNTPGVLRITRLGYTDDTGKVVVPDRVIAVGGYKIPKATQKQTKNLLENIAYYDNYPTKESRDEVDKRTFLRNVNPFKAVYEAKQKHGVFKLISEYIVKFLKTYHGVTQPSAKNSAYIGLFTDYKAAQDNDKPLVIYQVSTIIWNTIIARLAKLFGYYYVFPMIKSEIPDDPNDLKIKAFKELISDITTVGTISWTKIFIYPPLESAILTSDTIKTHVKALLDEPVVENVLNEMLDSMLRTVCKYTMNINLPLISYVTGNEARGMADSNAPAYIHSIVGVLVFAFIQDSNKETIIKAINAYAPSHVMTPIKNETIARNYLEYQGLDSGYIDPNYDTSR